MQFDCTKKPNKNKKELINSQLNKPISQYQPETNYGKKPEKITTQKINLDQHPHLATIFNQENNTPFQEPDHFKELCRIQKKK